MDGSDSSCLGVLIRMRFVQNNPTREDKLLPFIAKNPWSSNDTVPFGGSDRTAMALAMF